MDLVKHYGVGHCRTVDFFLRKPSATKEDEVLRAFKSALGFANFRCFFEKTSKQKTTCSLEFGSKTRQLLHLSKVHYLSQLVSIYKRDSERILSSRKVTDSESMVMHFFLVLTGFYTCKFLKLFKNSPVRLGELVDF